MLSAISSAALIYLYYRITRTSLAFFECVFVYLIAPLFYRPPLEKFRGRWTLVTGGTDGIGKAYTYELARRGLRKFILIGRSSKKLSDVKTYLEISHQCNVRTFVFDFAKDDMYKVREYINHMDIGLVVNSVGVGRENLERFGDIPEADMQILRVNGLASAEVIRCIQLCRQEASYRPIPGLAAYCASKSMMSFLAECIDRERPTIRVQCLTPALVATNMTYYKQSSLFVVSPEVFARQAVGTLGLVRVTSGCFNHEFQMLLRHLFPWGLLKYLIMPVYMMHKQRLTQLHRQSREQKGEVAFSSEGAATKVAFSSEGAPTKSILDRRHSHVDTTRNYSRMAQRAVA